MQGKPSKTIAVVSFTWFYLVYETWLRKYNLCHKALAIFT